MITVQHYWMGRDKTYAAELTNSIRTNAAETVRRVNQLLAAAAADGVEPGINPQTGTQVASGWRPAGVNAATPNAAKASKHMTGEACDIRDTAGRDLARWCLANVDKLREIGLWCERFQWTPTWVHFQIVPPASGLRIYVPSSAPPPEHPLPGEPPNPNH